MEVSFIPSFILRYISNNLQRQRDLNILLSGLLIILLFLLMRNHILEAANSIPHVCLFDYFLDIKCPGCGITRALAELATGNIQDAYRLNPAAFYIAGLLIAQIVIRSFILFSYFERNTAESIFKDMERLVIIAILFHWIINP